ncbi:glycosyltransferase family 1 protein [Ruficoccus amylovorans]|uniref:Glycosyltransferase family 1 protein n=1 Tax=Ruficoccus amylovorans TaxID=1804625 RepID=A0A842HFM4_9BACT|nr:glycosyltransferase family 1 protein [Ruficoccus amylovorans]MBC2594436.1 glycosyltransferase family 1 protein [Ruficoccus amylovorans]
MKIALVTETFPPEVNGVAMTLRQYVVGMRARGYEVSVVRPRQQADRDGPLHDFPEHLVKGYAVPRYEGLQFGGFCRGRLKRLWREERPMLVHVATEGPLGMAALFAAGSLGIPVVSTYHTNFHSYGDHYGYGWFSSPLMAYLRWFHNRTLATFVPSEDLKRTLEEARFKNVRIFSRGVDTRLFGPHRRSEALRRSWGVESAAPVVAYVGRVAAEKNLPLTVRAFERFRERHPAARLLVVGDGPERKKLEREHPEYIFAGMRRGEDLAAHYASADLFFFASTTETFGNVITEAMASGLVVLAYNYAAALHHVRDGVNGYTAAYDNDTAYLAAVDRLCDDEPSWPGVSAAAVRTAKALSWDAVLARYESDVRATLGADFKLAFT